MPVRKEVAGAIEYAEMHGFKLVGMTGSGHYKLRHPKGSIVVAATPTKGGMSKTLARVRRIAGVQVPRQRSGRSRHKKGSGFDPMPSVTERQASEVIAAKLAELKQIDHELSAFAGDSRAEYDRAKKLAARRVQLAEALKAFHQPVPELEVSE